ncbi:serine hydrolase domain-containing protein [Saccharicrinis sp. FJH62]|uniref:serine hydrolase domain-containing protein n=1 Tax=Saccharicrinis sp. FJH62 TaxID=3344657 RepID=UPI0035D4F783
MKQLILIIILAFAVSSFEKYDAENITNAIDSFIQEQMGKFHIPAISVAVINNGNIIFKKSYGYAIPEYSIPNTNTTAFQLGSVTKLITATAVMKLVEDNKLDLNEKVSFYLKELPESWNNMKVIDLLSHQSGIFDLLSLKHDFKSLDEALDTAINRPLEFEPGTKTVYAGGDYAVVMKLIETVSGEDFQSFLKRTLFEKAGMKHAVYNNMIQDYIYRTYDVIPNNATVYTWNETQHKQQIFSMNFPSWTYTSGGLFASINDLTKWTLALDNNTILKPENRDLMWTSAKLRNGDTSPFGVGWIVDQHNNEKATGHSGGPALADVVHIPDKDLTVIVLTNQLNLRPFLAMHIIDIYTEFLKS